MSTTHILLLRGINVGGRNRLPMAELRTLVEELGGERVRTYIQSGNVVFEAGGAAAATVAEALPARLAEQVGNPIPVVMRTAEAFRAAVEAHPFVDEAEDPKHLHIGFLADEPGAEAIASLDPDRSEVDRFAVRGREVHLHIPGGMARTKLTTDWFDRRLGTVMTVRNWRTVNRLLDMAEEAR